MSKAVYFVSFTLKKGASVADFLAATKNLNDGHISKQKGYISWQQLVDGDTWADYVTFETMADIKNFLAEAHKPNELAEKFFAYIDLNSCKSHVFSVENSF